MSKLISYFRSLGYIDDTNEQIIKYGLRRLASTVFDFTFSLLLAAILGNALVGILFEFAYFCLRIYAGGYHAPNEKICFYLSYLATILCILYIFFVPSSIYYLHISVLISIIVLSIFSPVESKNKPLYKQERKNYRNKCFFILSAELIFYFLMIWGRYMIYAKTVCVALFLVMAGQIVELVSMNNRRVP